MICLNLRRPDPAAPHAAWDDVLELLASAE